MKLRCRESAPVGIVVRDCLMAPLPDATILPPLTCDQMLDPDERDRWDRVVKNREATIEELKRKVAELEGQLAAIVGRSTASSHGERGLEGCAPRESTRVENSTGLNQNPPSAEVATSAEGVVCVQPLDSAVEILRTPEFVNQEAAKAAPPAPPLCR